MAAATPSTVEDVEFAQHYFANDENLDDFDFEDIVDRYDSDSDDDFDEEDNIPLATLRARLIQQDYEDIDVTNLEWSQDETVHCILPFTKTPGPVNDNTGKEPVQFFKLFYTDALFEKIATETNRNAETKRAEDPERHKGPWRETSAREMQAYYGARMVMQLLRADRDSYYWYQQPCYFMLHTPGFWKVFTRDRFAQLTRYLHFDDESTAAKPGTAGHDRLYKVRSLLEQLQAAFEREYVPDCEMSIDEGMIPFKGRLSIKQYMKDKPQKWGVKGWLFCESSTGYLFRFEIYMGKDRDLNILVEAEHAEEDNVDEGAAGDAGTGAAKTNTKRKYGLATDVVMSLISGLENTGYHRHFNLVSSS